MSQMPMSSAVEGFEIVFIIFGILCIIIPF